MASPLPSHRRVVLLAIVAYSTATSADTARMGIPDAVQSTASHTITRQTLRAPIRFLADDALEGRGPGARGDALARLYLATQLEALGYEPGARDGQWQQLFDIVGIAAQAPQTWTFKARDKNVDLQWSSEFIAASGVQQEQSKITDAELVFVGYGIEAPEHRWNDFKGVNLESKVLLMLNNDPDWDPELFAGPRRLYYGRWVYKYESAARQGAAIRS